VAGAAGPLAGGWLIDATSWRLIFFLNVPVAAAWMALRHVPETSDDDAGPLDLLGAALVSAGIALVAYALIERQAAAGVAGLAGLAGFVAVERARDHPMLPLFLFASGEFSGANLTTFAVYGAMGAAIFLVVLRLQVTLGYTALEAGTSLLPFTGLMLLLSARVGALAQRIGPRRPMTVAAPLGRGAAAVLPAGAGSPLSHHGAPGGVPLRARHDGHGGAAHLGGARRRRPPPGRAWPRA
jgi:hypothetical protein